MRVGIDTSTLRVRHAGIAVYTLELAAALIQLLNEDETLIAFDGLRFRPITPTWPEHMRNINHASTGDRTAAWRHLRGPLERAMRASSLHRRLLRHVKDLNFRQGEDRLDLFHAVVTLQPGRTGKPVIPLVHNVSILRFPETHPLERVRAFERGLPQITQAPVINTVSAFSRDEIAATLGYPIERIVVTHPGVSSFFRKGSTDEDATELAALGLAGRRFILLVGTQEPRKNIKTAVAAFAALSKAARRDAVLVIAGGKGWGTMSLPPGAARLIEDGSIRFLGYVTRPALRALYRHTATLVFPSIYEGFGIPAAEALACGTSVAFSRGTSLAEVVGPHGIGIDSGDEQGWRDAMHAALAGGPASPLTRRARSAWAAQFDWTANAARTLAMYRAVAKGGPLPAKLAAAVAGASAGTDDMPGRRDVPIAAHEDRRGDPAFA